ncbi:hypothetical protein [Bacillus phage YungSlug]|nr:hypothetical protein [Bacillus phage YungSlug]
MIKFITVVRALHLGIEVKMGTHNWVYVAEKDKVGQIGIKGKRYSGTPKELGGDDEGEEVYMFPQFDLNAFIQMCAEIPDEEIFALKANIALVELQMSQRKERLH